MNLNKLEKLLNYRPKVITAFKHFYVGEMKVLIQENKDHTNREKNYTKAMRKAGHRWDCPLILGTGDDCNCITYQSRELNYQKALRKAGHKNNCKVLLGLDDKCDDPGRCLDYKKMLDDLSKSIAMMPA